MSRTKRRTSCGWLLTGACVLQLLLFVTSAQAGENSYSNTIAGGPAFDRPGLNCLAQALHTGMHHHLQPLTVDTDGSYAFESAQDGGYDGFLVLYEEGFEASDPAQNCIKANDEGPGGVGTSAFSADLIAGTQYILVTTSFDVLSEDPGTFSNTISGPGEIILGASFVGSNAGAPLIDRAEPGCDQILHLGVHYRTQPFVVDADGDYSFTSVQDGFDGVLGLYAGAFNRSNALADCAGGNDDGFSGFETSSFTATLSAATQYVLLTAGYDAVDEGSFTNTIAGPGRVALGGVVYSGSTIGAPVYNRVLADCSVLSGTGTAVPYDLRYFFSDAVGDHTFSSVQEYDGYLALYEGFSFDPDNALVACLAGNDDGPPGIGTSLFTHALPDAFEENTLITTGFDNFESGTFINQISGPSGSEVVLEETLVFRAGTTTGAPTFDRPDWDDCSAPSGDLAAYQATPFSVNVSGNYGFGSTQEGGWDGYLLLYEAPFNPADGTSNCLDGNDDSPAGIGFSLFIAAPLKAFRNYVLVTTGFDDTDSGDFNNVFAGPGVVVFDGERIFGNGFEGQ